MKTKQLSFIVSCKDKSMDSLLPALEQLGEEKCLSARCSYSLTLVLDEVLTNIFNYAFDDGDDHSALVRLDVDETSVMIRVEDEGRPFNPLESPEPATHLPPEMRDKPIGGLGIHLMRKLMDRVEYERKGNKNILTMTKTIERESGE